jgi:hypothetical protein
MSYYNTSGPRREHNMNFFGDKHSRPRTNMFYCPWRSCVAPKHVVPSLTMETQILRKHWLATWPPTSAAPDFKPGTTAPER